VLLVVITLPFLRGDDPAPRFDPAPPTGAGAVREIVDSVGLHDVAFSPDGQRVIAVSDDIARSWWLAEGGSEGQFMRGCGASRLVYAPVDGPVRAVGCADGRVFVGGPSDHDTNPYASREGPLEALPASHPRPVTDLDFSGDGRLLVSASIDGILRVWDVAARAPVGAPFDMWPTVHGIRTALGITGVAFLPDNRTVAVAGADQVTLFDIRSRTAVAVAPAGGRALSVAISPDGQTMAIGRDSGSVQLWSLRERRNVGRPLPGLDSYVYRVAFSATGDFLVGGSQRATVIWNTDTGEQITPTMPGGSGFALNPNGRTIAVFDHNHPVIRLYPTRVN
jgi:WD40 repeat protein